MDTEDGRLFIKHLAYYIRTHEKALANALQQNRVSRHGQPTSENGPPPLRRVSTQPISSGAQSTLASALSFGWGSASAKPAKLYLTPNQLYFLLSRFEELGVTVGPMNVRLESISSDSTPLEYVSFLTQTKKPKGRSADQDSLHSVSSVRSVVSAVSSMWSNFGLSSNSVQKEERRRAAELEDVKYLYSAFTKIPCLKLALDHRIRRIKGFEEFPFDTAVPVWAFKNLSALDIVDLDFRSFFGWDRLADQLRSLTLKRAGVDDLTDVLTNIVLDDMDKRRRRSAKASSPVMAFASPSPAMRKAELARTHSAIESRPTTSSRQSADRAGLAAEPFQGGRSSGIKPETRTRMNSLSPQRRRRSSAQLFVKPTIRQRRSSSSGSSGNTRQTPRTSSSNLLAMQDLPSLKWRFLRHLSVADNGLTTIEAHSLVPLMATLQSLDLSSNLFTEIPDGLASLVSLRALNLSNCMIESLHSLVRHPLPAITVLNLRGNRLQSIAGIEKLPSLERLDLRDNRLRDPSEVARLTAMPNFKEVFVCKNPFTKTHSSYRLTIFNLFRQSVSQGEDILIDATGPTYNERKYLVDRMKEPQNVPVVRPPFEDESTVTDEDSRKVDRRSHETVEIEAESKTSNGKVQATPIRHVDPDPEPIKRQATPSTPVQGSAKSGRRSARRRVIDMSQADSPGTPESILTYGASPEATPTFMTALQTPPRWETKNEARPGSENRANTLGSDEYDSPTKRPLANGSAQRRTQPIIRPELRPDLSLSSDQYRRHIEALKQEHGNRWLNALNNDNDPFYRKDVIASPGAVSSS